MTRPALTVLSATIGLGITWLAYRLGAWNADVLDALDPLARIAIVVGAIVSWGMIVQDRHDRRVARDLALVREAIQQPPERRPS